MITRDDKIDALRREIAFRRAMFPKRVERHLMTQEKADQEIAIMEAILHDYIGPEPSLTAKDETRVTS
jgi:hypothetical protein